MRRAELERALAENVEQRTKSGRQPLRTLQQELGTKPLNFGGFERGLRRFLPWAPSSSLHILFEGHADENDVVWPERFARHVFGVSTADDNRRAARSASRQGVLAVHAGQKGGEGVLAVQARKVGAPCRQPATRRRQWKRSRRRSPSECPRRR